MIFPHVLSFLMMAAVLLLQYVGAGGEASTVHCNPYTLPAVCTQSCLLGCGNCIPRNLLSNLHSATTSQYFPVHRPGSTASAVRSGRSHEPVKPPCSTDPFSLTGEYSVSLNVGGVGAFCLGAKCSVWCFFCVCAYGTV